MAEKRKTAGGASPDASLTGADLAELTKLVRGAFDVKDRRYGLPPRKYPKCFVGSAAVAAMIKHNIATDAGDAERVGNLLLQAGIFRHVFKFRGHLFQK